MLATDIIRHLRDEGECHVDVLHCEFSEDEIYAGLEVLEAAGLASISNGEIVLTEDGAAVSCVLS